LGIIIFRSYKQMRSIFDEGNTGMILVDMPGIEKRIARFPVGDPSEYVH